jgi:hypothetical protein
VQHAEELWQRHRFSFVAELALQQGKRPCRLLRACEHELAGVGRVWW